MNDDELPNRWGFLGNSPGNAPANRPDEAPGRSNVPVRQSAPSPKTSLPYSPIAAQTARHRDKLESNYNSPGGHGPKKKKSFFMRFIVYPCYFFGILGIIIFLAGAIYFHSKALGYDLEKLKLVPERTLVYDRHGDLMGHVSGQGENRIIIPVDKVSQNFIKALIAREDVRFYQHGGVDYPGFARAALRNLKSGQMDQGASTLTMQLARNTFGMQEKTILRKLTEIAISKRLEREYEKDDILSYYVNRIYFGAGIYGIERAAQGYFMKPATELTLGEGAMLAGVIRGPSLLNPFRNFESAKGVRDETLARMVSEKFITQEQANAAKLEPITLRPPEMRFATGSYGLQDIHNYLAESLSEDVIKQGGLRVYCTIDSKLQKAAEEALEAHLTKMEQTPGWAHEKRNASNSGKEAKTTNYLQGAVVSLDNSSGAILTYVGGRSFNESPFNRAVLAKRQAGSTFKPFVYAVAFDRGGLLPGTYISDGPIQYRQENGKIWSPKNYDGTYEGNKPAAWGLIKSRNTMSIRVGDIASLEYVQRLADKLYFGKIPNSPVSYLGAFEATPMVMTSAFSTFACGGVNYTPYLIERIENSAGKILFQSKPHKEPVFRPSVAWMTADVLEKVFTEGTAIGAASLGYTTPAYGKTGTTNDNKDAWFVGFTNKVTTGVWIGFDNPKSIMSTGTGSSLALPVWTSIMKEADNCGYKGERIPPPSNATQMFLCRECGLNASRRTTDQEVYQMNLPLDLKPRGECAGHQKQTIFTKSPDWYKQEKEAGNIPSTPSDPQVFQVLKRWWKNLGQ